MTADDLDLVETDQLLEALRRRTWALLVVYITHPNGEPKMGQVTIWPLEVSPTTLGMAKIAVDIHSACLQKALQHYFDE